MKRGRGDFDIRRRRQREIEAIAQHVGAAATEDFDAYLVAWLQALPKSNDRIFAAQNAALRMSGNITENRAQSSCRKHDLPPRPRAPDGWARALGLTYRFRQQLGITTIGS